GPAGSVGTCAEPVDPPVDVAPPPDVAGLVAGCWSVVLPLPTSEVVGALVTVSDDTSGLATSTENGVVESTGSSVPTPPGASCVMYGTIARLSWPGVVSAPPSTRNVTVAPSEDRLPV